MPPCGGPKRAILLACLAILAAGCGKTPETTPVPAPKPQPITTSPSAPGGIAVTSRNPSFGRFSGRLALAPPGCENSKGPGVGSCKVLETDFAFRGSVTWKVRANLPTDGASIPKFAWGAIGKPFDGSYLPAAVIHDNYCENPVRPFIDTHRVFHAMLRALGVEPDKAAIMYAAVLIGGPKWIELAPGQSCGDDLCIRGKLRSDPALKGLQLRNGNLWQPPQTDAARRDAFLTAQKRVMDKSLGSLDAIDAYLRATFPEDPFLSLGPARQVSLDAFASNAMRVKRSAGQGG